MSRPATNPTCLQPGATELLHTRSSPPRPDAGQTSAGADHASQLIKTGMLVGAISVVGQRMADGEIETSELELDLNMKWGE